MIKRITNAIVFVLLNILLLFVLNELSYKKEDVNRDGVVNALDLLIVQKYIIEEHEEEI